MIANANAVRPQPAIVSRPKIVENHSASSDMIQSTDAKVTVSTRKSSPGALTVRKRTLSAGVVPLAAILLGGPAVEQHHAAASRTRSRAPRGR